MARLFTTADSRKFLQVSKSQFGFTRFVIGVSNHNNPVKSFEVNIVLTETQVKQLVEELRNGGYYQETT